MKKEYIIIAALIVFLSAYLFFHKENKDNYDLPAIQKIDTDTITSIQIEKADGPVNFIQKDKTWTISDKNFPAEIKLVETMLDTLKNLKLTTLVSQKDDLSRYELDKENRIKVTIIMKEKDPFEFTIGKTAPTFNHTFVMLAADKNVYHAKGSFRNDFDKDVHAFRDKKVLEVKMDAIKQFSVIKENTARTLIAEETKNEKEKYIKTWLSADGKSADQQKVSDFLSSISYLKCDSYPENMFKNKFKDINPNYSIHIDAQEKIIFNLYKSQDAEQYYGISSMNEYVFVLSNFSAKEITDSIDTFLAVKKE